MTGKPPPGEELAKILARFEPYYRVAFLAWVEEKARSLRDLEALREIRAYKANRNKQKFLP
jgi:hypothetical protein